MSDDILFVDESGETVVNKLKNENWKILIVDDEREIHLVTKHVLKDFNFMDRGIDFYHAYSAEEAKQVLQENSGIALIFLDVVMETDDAGLKLIEWVRSFLENRFIRIVLRTGQPGLAPEKEVILNYDIDDYRAKTELTAVRLFTTTVASLRAYRIMMDQEENRKALEALVKTSWSISSTRTAEAFLNGIMPQISSFMSLGEHSFFSKIDKIDGKYVLNSILSTGRFSNYHEVGGWLTIHEHEIVDIALNEGHHVFEDKIVVGVLLNNDPVNRRLIFIESNDKIKNLDISVLKIFLSSLDSAYENMKLSSEIEDAHVSKITMQKTLLDRLNNAISIRSKETAGHMQRVSDSSTLLAKYYGCTNDYIELLRTASPMHDIGKIGIPDSILLKEGPLTKEEREIINTHTTLGQDMFLGDESPLIVMIREITGGHHEKWDGTGYPNRLSGDSIPLSGRITAICDVFDALLSERPYKKSFNFDKTMEIMLSGKGTHFDPDLLDLFLVHIDEMREISQSYQ